MPGRRGEWQWGVRGGHKRPRPRSATHLRLVQMGAHVRSHLADDPLVLRHGLPNAVHLARVRLSRDLLLQARRAAAQVGQGRFRSSHAGLESAERLMQWNVWLLRVALAGPSREHNLLATASPRRPAARRATQPPGSPGPNLFRSHGEGPELLLQFPKRALDPVFHPRHRVLARTVHPPRQLRQLTALALQKGPRVDDERLPTERGAPGSA